MSKAPFLTGSHAYGKPHENSDIDIVVWVENTKLRGLLEENGYPIRFGNLNLILVDSEDQWEAWQQGTKDLLIRAAFGKPVTRDEAVEHLKSLRVTQTNIEKQPYSDIDWDQ